jgi:hypothetical protein
VIGGRGSELISVSSASYSQDVEFYHLFQIREKDLDTKVVSVIELQL